MEENQTDSPSKKPMNKMLIIGVIVAVLLIGGGILLFGGKGANGPANSIPAVTNVSDELTAEQDKTINPTSDAVSIETQNFAFSPSTIKIKAGGTISYTNKDSVSHSFTADDGKSFDSGLVSRDQTKTVTAPTEPGTYPFHCTPHPSMKGTLIVE